MTKVTRTFIALELDEFLKRFLEDVIRQLAQDLPSVRWIDPAGIHLTLAFLGELTDEHLAEASAATEVAAGQVPPFSFRLTHPGVFGTPRQPRVIWMGIEERSHKLSYLQQVLTKELQQRGFEVDNRPFSPHLTLARLKNPLKPVELERLPELLARTPTGASANVQQVRRVSVMKSELLRTGAKYTRLKEYALQEK